VRDKIGMDDLLLRGIGGLAQGFRERRFASAAVVEACLERIARIDPTLRSFVHLDAEGARRAARDSDARFAVGAPRSMMEGVPVSVQDDIFVRGLPATWGSRAFSGFVPNLDELPVARLRAAGAIIVGKTSVPELTLGGDAANDLFGVARNPWDIALTPGGASGGAAAGVAGGLVPAALGTDGGGSIRRPAGHTGLVGFKPSTGRVPRIDGFPTILADFESIGTLTRTVADALLMDMLPGPDPRDRRSLHAMAPPFEGPRRRIVFIPHFGGAPVDPEVAQAAAEIARFLADAGHVVRRQETFFDLDDLERIRQVISRAGVAWLAERDGGRLGREAGAGVRQMAAEGRKLTAADYVDALDRVAAFRRRCAEFFAEADLVLTPTAAALPWPAELAYPTEIAGRPAGPRDHAVFSGWVNVAGLPAISLPVSVSRAGLPIGVQVAAGFGADAGLLEFALGFERRWEAPPLPEL
jgi:aspartyl-tRNA(Asn)/glutamyl-tRNA(Gln) amidotransferase subunit A